MSKLLKWILIITFIAVLCFGIASAEIVQNGTCGVNGDNLTWALDQNGILTISGEGAMKDFNTNVDEWGIKNTVTELVIEEGVTSIGSGAFYNYYNYQPWDNLTSVTLPSGLTSIGQFAFYHCISLQEITIPYGVTSIKENTFAECGNLTSISIPSSVTVIEQSALQECESLTSITIPGSVTSIATNAIRNCTNLVSITIEEGVTSIGNYTFFYDTGLTYLSIPSSITSIGNNAFNYCDALLDIHYGGTMAEWRALVANTNNEKFAECNIRCSDGIIEGTGNIHSGSCGDNVTWTLDRGKGTLTISGSGTMMDNNVPWLEYTASIRTVVIESGVTSICAQAFHWCDCMTSITIPDSITSIGNGAFEYCSGLTSVTIPGSVTGMGNDIFYGCNALTDIFYSGTKEEWQTLISGTDNSKLNFCVIHCSNGVLGESGNEQSGERDSFTWTLVGNTLTIDGEFYYNDNMPQSVLEAAETVVFSASIEDINGLEDFVNATAFQVDENNSEYNAADGVLFNYNNTVLVGFPSGRIGTYTVPEGVQTLGFNAFYGSQLSSIVFPQGLQTLSTQAIYACPNLQEITIPASVTNIEGNGYNFRYCWSFTDFHVDAANDTYEDRDGILYLKGSDTLYMYPCGRGTADITVTNATVADAAFIDNRNVTSVNFAEGVKQIGDSAFSGSTVSTIVLPVSLESIGEYAFGDSNLSTVYYSGTEEQWNTIAIGDNNEALTDADIHYTYQPSEYIAFGTCGDNLTWTLDSNGLLTISGTGTMADCFWNGEPLFSNASSILSVEIQDGVTSIGYYAFYECENLTDITIPSTVTYIGERAFSWCDNLEDVYFSGTRAQWKAISIGEKNELLYSANIHYAGTPSQLPAPIISKAIPYNSL